MPRFLDFSAAFRGENPITRVYFNGSVNDIGLAQRYFTRIDASSKGFSMPLPISLGSSSTAIRVRMGFIGAVSGRIRPAFSSATYIELDRFSNTIDFRYSSAGPSADLIAHEEIYDDGSIVEYLLTFNDSTVEGFVNGVSIGTTSRTPTAQQVDSVFSTGSSGSSVIYPLSVEAWAGTTDVNSEPDFKCLFDSDGTGTEEVDVIGGNNPQRVGMTSADTELFTYDSSSSSWKNSDESVVLPVTY